MSISPQSGLLVSFQFILLLSLALLSDLFVPCRPCWITLIVAILLGLWAISAMGHRNFNVIPDVKADAKLVHQHLPYARIRHPMYSSVLLFSSGLVFMPFTLLKLSLFVGLVVVLGLKAHYEERLLTKKFPEYATYQARTQRFIPFIF